MKLTPTLLAAAMTGCSLGRAAVWADPLSEAMEVFAINTRERAADFLAQLGHESKGLLYAAELWGPTPEQRTYERDFAQPWGASLRRGDRNFKAWGLGNAFAGDGRLYAGHGPMQVTGRRNHAQARDDLRKLLGAEVPDFEATPKALELPRWGALAGGNFWRSRDLNAFSDAGDFLGQTKRINGGDNGYADRCARRTDARKALGV